MDHVRVYYMLNKALQCVPEQQFIFLGKKCVVPKHLKLNCGPERKHLFYDGILLHNEIITFTICAICSPVQVNEIKKNVYYASAEALLCFVC